MPAVPPRRGRHGCGHWSRGIPLKTPGHRGIGPGGGGASSSGGGSGGGVGGGSFGSGGASAATSAPIPAVARAGGATIVVGRVISTETAATVVIPDSFAWPIGDPPVVQPARRCRQLPNITAAPRDPGRQPDLAGRHGKPRTPGILLTAVSTALLRNATPGRSTARTAHALAHHRQPTDQPPTHIGGPRPAFISLV
jgi:hypothetical protein